METTLNASNGECGADFDVLVVGAGMAGLYMLHRLRTLQLSALLLEAGSDVGGTWYWNRYPGARCDVESMDYSYSFSEQLQQEWKWSERFASQPEILSYLGHVADRFQLRDGIRFDRRVVAAAFDDDAARWTITDADGERYVARFCVMATGCLSAPNTPKFPGMEDFQGATYNTATWPQEPVSFVGKRVGVIGTGSSGVQAIPVIAEEADELTVFQRTATYSVPSRNGPMGSEYEAEVKRTYADRRHRARASFGGFPFEVSKISALAVSDDEREAIFRRHWQLGGFQFGAAFGDILTNLDANRTAADFVAARIRERVTDSATAQTLVPTSYPFATKRLCVDSNYFETYNRSNVRLVDLKTAPIERFVAGGVVAGGTTFGLDAIVFATGFDAMTGALNAMDIRNGSGTALRDEWAAGPRTYLGVMIAAFPNLFLVSGPGSPSVISNMAMSIEQHVEWISDCIAYLHENRIARMEAEPQAQHDWVQHVNDVAAQTLMPAANSWYLGANVPGKPRIFMPYIGGLDVYRDKCNQVAADGYRGFALGR